MSGHNKWSKIKHKKAITDAKKSQAFSKLVQLIQVESKKCGGDVNSPGLKMAIEKAKKVNMPSVNIERAVKKGTDINEKGFEEVCYESYGPGGSAIIIFGLTDNRNKSAAEIRHILSKNDLSLAQSGSAMWAFEKKENNQFEAKTTVDLSDSDKEKLNNLIEELEENESVQEVFVNVL
jgi:YebC/PmpR family DNA-binding regulatory protein